jgi:hypothetical protein
MMVSMRSRYIRRRPIPDGAITCELFHLFGFAQEWLLDLPTCHLSARSVLHGGSRVRFYNEKRRLVGTAERTTRGFILRDSKGKLVMRIPMVV